MESVRTTLINSAKRNIFVAKLLVKRLIPGIKIKDIMWISPTRLAIITIDDEEYILEIVKMGKYKTHVRVLKNFLTL